MSGAERVSERELYIYVCSYVCVCMYVYVHVCVSVCVFMYVLAEIPGVARVF